MRYYTVILFFLLTGTALGQNIPTTHTSAIGLTFGNGAIYTGTTKPTNGQAVCNNAGVLGGCVTGGRNAFTDFSLTPDHITANGATALPDQNTIYALETGNSTQTFTACTSANDGKLYVIYEAQDGTGGWTPTFAAPGGWTIDWGSGGVAPQNSTGANQVDRYGFQCDLTTHTIFSTGFDPKYANTSFSLWSFNVIFSAAGTPIPTCNSGKNHYRGCVSDATACTSGTTYTSGAGTACELWCNGSNWIESGSGC